MNIETLLEEMKMCGAADLYLSAGNPPIFRIDGVLHPADSALALTSQQVEVLVESCLTSAQKEAAWQQEGVRQVSIQASGITVRGEVFSDGRHLAAAFHRAG